MVYLQVLDSQSMHHCMSRSWGNGWVRPMTGWEIIYLLNRKDNGQGKNMHPPINWYHTVHFDRLKLYDMYRANVTGRGNWWCSKWWHTWRLLRGSKEDALDMMVLRGAISWTCSSRLHCFFFISMVVNHDRFFLILMCRWWSGIFLSQVWIPHWQADNVHRSTHQDDLTDWEAGTTSKSTHRRVL